MIFLLLEGSLLWLFLLLIFISLFITVQSDSPGWCSFVVGCGLLGLELFSPYHPITYIFHNPLYSLAIAAAYVCIGIIWLLIKWMSYTSLLKTAYQDYKAKWFTERPSTDPTNLIKFESNVEIKFGFKVPTKESTNEEYWAFVSKHKGSMYMWTIAWPFSLLGTFFDDPVRRLWRFIYSKVSATLVNIAKKSLGKI